MKPVGFYRALWRSTPNRMDDQRESSQIDRLSTSIFSISKRQQEALARQARKRKEK